jgi:hypothetical protein
MRDFPLEQDRVTYLVGNLGSMHEENTYLIVTIIAMIF